MSLIIATPEQLHNNQGMIACPYCSCRFMAGSAENAHDNLNDNQADEPTEQVSDTTHSDLETTRDDDIEFTANDVSHSDYHNTDEAPVFEPVVSEIVIENENALADDEIPDSLLYTPSNTSFNPLSNENENNKDNTNSNEQAISLETIRANIAARSTEFEAEDNYDDLRLNNGPKFLHAVLWGTACLLLILALPVQYGYFMRDDLAKHAPLRPLIKSMCNTLGCEVSLQRDISQIKIIGRDVRSHPDFMNALLIYVTLNNQATFHQAYPALELSFSDINGRPLAKRRFSPREYLPADINLKQGMAPNAPLKGKIEIVDPGKNAVNFQFEFF